MPLLDIQCDNGHLSEVLRRGGSDAPFVCPTCGEESKRVYSGFSIRSGLFTETGPPPDRRKRSPKYIERMGGGRAALMDDHGYRPALTHTAKCPQCARRRNVAILGDLGAYGLRTMCEACGYMWVHNAATASDPMKEGYDPTFKPRRHYSRGAPAGSGYEEPKRGN